MEDGEEANALITGKIKKGNGACYFSVFPKHFSKHQ